MSTPPSIRSRLFRSLFLLLFSLVAARGLSTNDRSLRDNDGKAASSANRRRSHQQRDLERRRERRQRRGKSQYYEFLDGNGHNNSKTTLTDIWLCMACALGWSIWLVGALQPPQELVFEQQESSKAMGHVLQVSLGEDILGTGIPVYYAVVDFVVEGDTDEDHIQVRKIFTSKKLLEEGFANVEVLYLTNDPTTAILLEDLLDQKKERESQAPPSNAYYAMIYFVSVVLIGTSALGGARMATRLEHPLYGWISLAVGLLLLYPSAKLLHRFVTYLYSLAGPLTERPGVIVHGKRLYWAQQCHDTLNPMEILGIHDNQNEKKNKQIESSRSIELSDLQLPTMDENAAGRKKNYARNRQPQSPPLRARTFGPQAHDRSRRRSAAPGPRGVCRPGHRLRPCRWIRLQVLRRRSGNPGH